MGVVHNTSKGEMLDTMEKLYIYKETRINNQIKYKCAVKLNLVFETLILDNTDRAHVTLKQPVQPYNSVTISEHTHKIIPCCISKPSALTHTLTHTFTHALTHTRSQTFTRSRTH